MKNRIVKSDHQIVRENWGVLLPIPKEMLATKSNKLTTTKHKKGMGWTNQYHHF